MGRRGGEDLGPVGVNSVVENDGAERLGAVSECHIRIAVKMATAGRENKIASRRNSDRKERCWRKGARGKIRVGNGFKNVRGQGTTSTRWLCRAWRYNRAQGRKTREPYSHGTAFNIFFMRGNISIRRRRRDRARRYSRKRRG